MSGYTKEYMLMLYIEPPHSHVVRTWGPLTSLLVTLKENVMLTHQSYKLRPHSDSEIPRSTNCSNDQLFLLTILHRTILRANHRAVHKRRLHKRTCSPLSLFEKSYCFDCDDFIHAWKASLTGSAQPSSWACLRHGFECGTIPVMLSKA